MLKCWKLTWYKALDRRAQQQPVGFQRGLFFDEAESGVRRLKSEG
jgi:hypothetical protein